MNASIIIPCYNNSHCILDSIQSCRDLKLEDVEIIVVDDCSTDNLKEVIADIGDVNLISLPENRGPGVARNIGVESSKYDNLLFLDSDDIFLEDARLLIEELSNSDVVYGNFLYNDNRTVIPDESCLTMDGILKSNPFTSVFACKRRVWDLVEGYPEDRDIYEDWAFLAKAFGKGFKFKHVDRVTFNYRRTNNGRFSSMKSRRKIHFRKTLSYINDFLE